MEPKAGSDTIGFLSAEWATGMRLMSEGDHV
jgi:hypothetical protein